METETERTPIEYRFARNVRDMLNRKGMTQRELARRSGVSYVHICNILRGHTSPSLDLAWRIAVKLSSRPFSLFERKALD
jgi:transcriptional regulator with XRE-family HTH domain